jgi:hypothetical protein
LITEEPMTYEVVIKADRENEADNFVVVKMKVEYPETYPNVIPKFQFKNLSPKNLQIGEFNNCHKIFRDTAEEMHGEQMIFQIIENIREYLKEINEVFMEKKRKEEEEEKIKEDNMGKKYIAETRLDYTPVNKETFSVWLAKFMIEREKQKEEELKKRSKEQIEKDNRISGRNHFLEKQGLIGSNITFEEDEIDQLIEEEEKAGETFEDEEKVYYDEELFDEEDVEFDELE